MPVHKSTKNGKPCYKWGSVGTCYTYKSGNEASRKRAKKKAIKQGLAVSYNSGRRVEL